MTTEVQYESFAEPIFNPNSARPAHTHLGELAITTPESERVNALSRNLLRDFYQTFRLAQVDTAVQRPLFKLLEIEHERSGNTQMLPEAVELASKRIGDLKLPKRHKTITDADALRDPETGFEALWKNYTDILLQVDEATDVRSSALVLEDMLVQDYGYQRKPRPNRREGDDVHESIVREYILGDKLEGLVSDEMLRVRDVLRTTLIHIKDVPDGYNAALRTMLLTENWGKNHPGQSFFRT